MPRPRGNLSITMRRRPPTGPPQRKRFIRQRSTAFLPMLFMTLAGCKAQKLLRPQPPRSTQPAPLRRRRKAAQRLSRVLFLPAFLPQTSKQEHRKANLSLLWPPRQARQLLGRNLRVGKERLNSLPFPRRKSRARRDQAGTQKRLQLLLRDRLLV